MHMAKWPRPEPRKWPQPREEPRPPKDQIIADTQSHKDHAITRLIPFLCFWGINLNHLSAVLRTEKVNVQSMLFLRWDATLQQWASTVSPQLASPHLSMAFFLLQDIAFVCALAWYPFHHQDLWMRY